ncbi:phage tail assembly chaperone [[Pseudomonas] carboxydohydrogena]|uniref:Phage tail assembly chaperone n=1 Tax=Afipia carboxydohydrogena TaxID=290 RepID=A0ABY8BKK8_AFICR|nr:rcc01693 family protein [[Pseudomonas] carboxydohydrogena]WEF50528.1 phage tail assembly chaperone [[Pseudomonas] carboxydohydrogena]
MQPFPWDEAIGLGLGVLRLSPAQFWAMTPRELAFAIRAARGVVPEPIDRTSLDNLIQKFPDRAEAPL